MLSRSDFQSRVREGTAGLRYAGLSAPPATLAAVPRVRTEAEAMDWSKEAICAGVLPRSVVFALRVTSVDRRVFAYGVPSTGPLIMPGLGEIRNFWFSEGMERVWKMWEESEERVASAGKGRV